MQASHTWSEVSQTVDVSHTGRKESDWARITGREVSQTGRVGEGRNISS